MIEEKIKLIGYINFKDIEVQIYNDPYSDKNTMNVVWQIRNPNSSYQGICYQNLETGKISYPENAIIPKQTKKDREILPKFVITGYDTIDNKFISFLLPKLVEDYNKKNNI